MRDVKAMGSRLEDAITDVKLAIARIEATLTATLPHRATKADLAELRSEMRAELAEKPGKAYLWGVLAVVTTAYAAGLAALAILK